MPCSRGSSQLRHRVPGPLAGGGSTTARGKLRLCPASACQTGLPWSSPPATRRQHVSIFGSGWAASRASRKWLSWVGEEGGQGEKKQPRACAACCFPGRFPPLTDAKPWQTAPLRTLWFLGRGTAPCEEAAAGSPTGESRAPGYFCKLFQPRARTGPWMQRVRLDHEIMVPSTWDQTLQVSRERHVLPSSLSWPRVQPRGPQAAQAQGTWHKPRSQRLQVQSLGIIFFFFLLLSISGLLFMLE